MTPKGQSVRDLEWLLLSSPLINIPGIKNFSCNVDTDWLSDVNKNTSELESAIASRKRSSLGNYFETLFAFFLKNTKNIKILARNLQVFDEVKTIGEFDFIIDDSGVKKHIEVAVKFYLGTGDTKRHENWYGPNAKDRLDIKMNRLVSHQLKLSETKNGALALKNIGVTQVEKQVFIKGYFFYPYGEKIEPPEDATSDNSGWWIRKSDANKVINNGEWAMLPKPLWLSKAIIHDESKIISPGKVWEQKTPQMFVRLIKNGDLWQEEERIFIVSDDWPN